MGHNCKNIIDITYTTPFFYYWMVLPNYSSH